MKTKHLLILAVIFIGLLGLLGILTYLERDRGKPDIAPFLDLDTGSLNSITLQTATETIVLQKQDAGWMLSEPISYPANPNHVTTLLDTISDLETDSIISTNPDRQASMEVDDASGTKVTLAAGSSTVAQFYVGKITPDYNHTYVRLADSDEIKTAKGTVQTIFKKTATDWRDKTVYKQDAATINKLTLTQADGSFTLNRDAAGSWIIEGQEAPIDQTKVTTLLSTIGALNATAFIDSPDGIDFTTPSLTITINDTDTLAFQTQDENYYAKRSEQPQIFTIAPFAYDNINLHPADFVSTAEQ